MCIKLLRSFHSKKVTKPGRAIKPTACTQIRFTFDIYMGLNKLDIDRSNHDKPNRIKQNVPRPNDG